MALKGDLQSVDLAQVFQMLVLNQKVGILSIYSPKTWKALFFDERGVTLYYNEFSFLDKLVEYLVRTGKVTENQINFARDYAHTHDTTLEDALFSTQAITQEEYRQIFSQQMEEEIYDLFFWENARFEFFENATELPGKEGVINEAFFFNPDSMIMEAARRMDEWSVIKERISGPDEVLAPIADLSNVNLLDLDDITLSVFDLVDGKRSVGRIIEITGLSAFHVYKALSTLLEQGYLELLGPAELSANAMECLAEGRVQDGINLLEKAVSLGEGGEEIHLTIAKAYESIGELEDAARHYKTYADYLVSMGEAEEAVNILNTVISLIPTDLRAREMVLSIITSQGEELKRFGIDPIEEGRTLIGIYVEMGDFERARAVVESLLDVSPGDLELIKSLISIHSKAGDTKRVLELYELLAEEYLRRKDLMSAIKYLQKILLIDKDRRDISERIRQLYLQEEKARSRRRGLITLVSIILCFMAFGSLFSLYEMKARRAFEKIDPSSYIEKKDFASAAALYQNFLRKYPFTFIRSSAKAELERIKALEEEWNAELKKKEAVEKAAVQRKRRKYKRLYKKYEELGKDKKDLVGALAALEVAKLVREVGLPEDKAWAEAAGIESNLNDLRNYLKGAKFLKSLVDSALARGEYKVAYFRAKKLLERYSLSPEARTLEIPIRITTVPEGARLYVDGKPYAGESGSEVVTPFTLGIKKGETKIIELRKKGYRAAKLKISPETKSPLKVSLAMEPVEVYSFGGIPLTLPAVERDYMVVGLSGGKVACISRSRKKRLWELKLPGLSEIESNPKIAGGKVFFTTFGKMAKCADLETGKELWQRPFKGELKADPLPTPEGVVFVSTEGEVALLDSDTGAFLWEKRTGKAIYASPVIYQDFLFVPISNGEIAVFDLASGEPEDSYTVEGGLKSSPLIVNDCLLVPTTAGKVHCFSITGEEKWIFNHGAKMRKTALEKVGERAVVVSTEDGLLYRLELDTGEATQEFDLEKRTVGKPLVTEKGIYLGVQDSHGKGALLFLDMDTLVPHWEYSFQGKVSHGLVGACGKVFLSCTDRKVYAFP